VGELLRHALSDIFLRRELRDRDLEGALITVSEVRVSPDLKVATVYVSALGNFEPECLVKGLKRATPYLKVRVGGAVRLRHIPKFIFKVDPAIAQSDRIADVLHRSTVRRDLNSGLAQKNEPTK
jgi:ribosome-binding factor A